MIVEKASLVIAESAGEAGGIEAPAEKGVSQ